MENQGGGWHCDNQGLRVPDFFLKWCLLSLDLYSYFLNVSVDPDKHLYKIISYILGNDICFSLKEICSPSCIPAVRSFILRTMTLVTKRTIICPHYLFWAGTFVPLYVPGSVLNYSHMLFWIITTMLGRRNRNPYFADEKWILEVDNLP